MKLRVVLRPEADGGYSVICPALPGCISQGDNLEEAIANIREAIGLWLQVSAEDKTPVPQETPEIVSEEIRQCLKERAEGGLPLTIETREVQADQEMAA